MHKTKNLRYIIVASILCTINPSVRAAIHNVDENNSSANNPYAITISYSGEDSQVISSSGTVEKKSYVNIGSGVNFSNNIFKEPLPSTQVKNLHGSVIYAFNSVINFGGDNTFANNSFNARGNSYGAIYAASPYRVGEYGKPTDHYENVINFGNNTLFKQNSAVYGSAIVAEASVGGKNTFNFGDNTQFIDNFTLRNQVGNGGDGGVILSMAHGVIDQETANIFNFGDKTVFSGNKARNGGAIMTDLYATDGAVVTNQFNFNGDVAFTDNQASNYGAAIYSDIYGYDESLSDNAFNFYGTTTFLNNTSGGVGGAIVFMADKDDPNNVHDVLNFAPQKTGQYVRFEGNRYGNTLNSMYLNNTQLNFNLQKGTYADIRDPIYAQSNVTLNKGSDGVANGNGGLYLWGDNSSFSGKMNINSGSLYAMFEENQTSDQQTADPSGQRKEFKFNGNTTFQSGTYLRPMMNAARNQLAQLDTAKVSGASNAILVPYEISKLDPKNYTFNNNYTGFQGFDSPLAQLIVNGSTDVQLQIKRELAGYQNLGAAADAYRKSEMGYIDREVLDDIYLTGEVPQEIKDMFEIAGGDDYVNYNSIHRATVKQFKMQVSSRVHNKDYLKLDKPEGEHLWISTAISQVKKKQSEKGAGYKYDPRGVAAGFDHDFIPGELTAGIAAGYSYGDADNLTPSHIYAKDDVENYLMSLYGKFQKEKFYTSWDVGGGYFTNKTKFRAENINARGKYHSKAWFANAAAGYNLAGNGSTFAPYVGAEFTYLQAEAYSEKGPGARHFDKASWDIFETPIGIKIAQDFEFDSFFLTPTADIAYTYNFGDRDINTFASLARDRGNRWKVASHADKRGTVKFAASLKFNFKETPLSIHLGYAIDHRSDYQDQQAFGTLSWDF